MPAKLYYNYRHIYYTHTCFSEKVWLCCRDDLELELLSDGSAGRCHHTFYAAPQPGVSYMLIRHSTNLATSPGSIDTILKKKYCHKKSSLLEGGIKDINQLTYSV